MQDEYGTEVLGISSIVINSISHAAWLVYNGHECEYVWSDDRQEVVFRFNGDAVECSNSYVSDKVGVDDIKLYSDLHKDIWYQCKKIREKHR